MCLHKAPSGYSLLVWSRPFTTSTTLMRAPAKDDSQIVVMGVNTNKYDGSKNFVVCAPCTTNGLTPMVKASYDKFYSHASFSFSIGAQLMQRLKVYLFSNFDGAAFVTPCLRTLN